MKRAIGLLAVLVFSVSAFGAEAIDPEVLATREAAWRAWFAGDEAALRAMLPDEFLGIDAGGKEIKNLERTLASARAFKESGGRLVSLAFPETHAQRFGDTIVLYGSYEAKLVIGKEEEVLRGRLTEVFIKRDGKWVHPGWHLDLR